MYSLFLVSNYTIGIAIRGRAQAAVAAIWNGIDHFDYGETLDLTLASTSTPSTIRTAQGAITYLS